MAPKMATRGQKNVFLGYNLNDPKQVQAFENYLAKEITEGKNLKEILHFSDRVMENLYALAYSLYQRGRYADATKIFSLLIFFDPRNYRYQYGIAAAMQLQNDYIGAIEHYASASYLEPANPYPDYYMVECFLKLNDTEAAILALENVINKSGTRKDLAALKHRAQLAKVALEGERAASQRKAAKKAFKGKSKS